MNYQKTVYDLATGAVQYTVLVPDEAYDFAPDGTGLYAGHIEPETQYIDTATDNVIPRPAMALTFPASFVADGVAEGAITGIPSGAVVTWPDGVETTETDGSVELSTDTPGTYTFRISLFPYQDATVTMEATEV